MAKPTTEQIRTLEREHKNQFVRLVGAAKFYQMLSKNYAWLPNTDYRKKALLKFGTQFTRPLGSWIKRQARLERAGIPKMPVVMQDFFSRERMPYLEQLIASINGEAVAGRSEGDTSVWDSRSQRGMGFVPLIIWAVIAIVAAFTATEIVDETNTTVEERQELMDSSAQTCAELNLSPEQCAQMINNTQTQATTTSGGGIGLMGWALLAFLGFTAFKNHNKKSAA